MKFMKQWIIAASLVSLVLVMGYQCAAAEWQTDVHAAMDKAASEKKLVLLDFTGSDWCGWCMKFKSEVLDSQEFGTFANANLELVEVDFPHNKPQAAEVAAQNQALSRTYDVHGFPTFVLIDTMGKEVWRQVGYRPGGPKAFEAELEKASGMKHTEGPAPKADDALVAKHEPKFVPIAPATPTKYGALALKGISGAKGHRMALINNETLMAGETAHVKVNDGKVEITCLEVREDSVLISVDGKQRELMLHQP